MIKKKHEQHVEKCPVKIYILRTVLHYLGMKEHLIIEMKSSTH